MKDLQTSLRDFLDLARGNNFAAEAKLFGNFSCDDVLPAARGLHAGVSVEMFCLGDDVKRSLYVTDTEAWSEKRISSFFADLAAALGASELIFAVLRPSIVEFEQARRMLQAAIAVVQDPRNPSRFAEVVAPTGTLRSLDGSGFSQDDARLAPRAAWMQGDNALAGFLLVETATSVEELQAWLIDLVDRCSLWVDLEEIGDLRRILADRDRWGEAKAAFSALRRLTIGADPKISDHNEVSIYMFCENAAKLAYNLTWPSDPFDRGAGHLIGPSFAKAAEIYGADDLEQVLFGNARPPGRN